MSAKMAEPLDAVSPPENDPAMDGILASIRKILNEDEALGGPSIARPMAPEDQPAAYYPAADGAMPGSSAALAAGALAFANPEPAAPKPATGSTPEPLALTTEMMVSAPNAPAPVTPLNAPSSTMLNASAAAATAASVGELIRAVAADRTAGVSRAGTTIEDIVRDEMRPIIKEWLDRHLPGMVERLVRAEIERVVSRAMA